MAANGSAVSTVHPRSRGERLLRVIVISPFVGSSPLTRGTLCTATRLVARGRFIPAHAGNAPGKVAGRNAGSVHPRSRGERGMRIPRDVLVAGSSPLTRGTRHERQRRRTFTRFIPAHAGNANNLFTGAFGVYGSSPLTRGTRLAGAHADNGLRFIPAHAGNAGLGTPPGTWETVHPRSRGERQRRSSRAGDGHGSSPLTRGTHRSQGGGDFRARFIPAHAGNAGSDRHRQWRAPVHPRSRGERRYRDHAPPPGVGSSPLTRGTHRIRPSSKVAARFIPAHAGNA